MGKGTEEEKAKLFMEAFQVMYNFYLDTHRDIHMNERFWYTLLCVHKRDFIINLYTQVGESIKEFHNIVVKKFDWENYIYKCILAAQYVKDNTDNEDELEEMFMQYLGYYYDLSKLECVVV